MLLISTLGIAQVTTMGTTANFVLFTRNGAMGNTGTSQLTGNVGTHNGSITGFGNVNGNMDNADAATSQCDTDLHILYNQLDTDRATFHPVSTILGNGDTLVAGVYAMAAATTLNLNLFLNANGDPNAVFIFQIPGTFSTGALAKVILLNGAKACNVFWKTEGQVSLAAGTTIRGTIVANNSAIVMSTGDTLEGRALSTTGAVTVSGVLAYTPIGCGSPTLNGPTAPNLAGTACYAIFSSNGAVTNTGTTHLIGDVGTNAGLTTGYNALDVTGTIHPISDGSTAACAADLLTVYTYLNTLAYDIKLLYPAQFGHNLVLTPHTYLLNSAVTFTDTLYLNAEGNANAVFVIQVNGAFSTSTYSKVVLINNAQAKNVYWLINGAVSINNFSIFNGTIICNNGAINLNKGIELNGGALTTSGQFTTDSIIGASSMIPGGCAALSIQTLNTENVAIVYPNPCGTSTTVMIDNISKLSNCEWRMYNVLGEEVMYSKLIEQSTNLSMGHLSPGIYFYRIISNNLVIQSGKLSAQL